MTPFKAVYGCDPPPLIPYYSNEKDPPKLARLLPSPDKILQQLQQILLKVQTRMKRLADKKRDEIVFTVGDCIWVKLQPYRLHSLALRKNQKLGMRYFGPFQISHRFGSIAYRLSLLLYSHIHLVFHVFLIKYYKISEINCSI